MSLEVLLIKVCHKKRKVNVPHTHPHVTAFQRRPHSNTSEINIGVVCVCVYTLLGKRADVLNIYPLIFSLHRLFIPAV